MHYVYPARFTPDHGTVMVSFPDVPEALTSGRDEADAREQAVDCLLAALEGYVEARRPLPRPSPARGRPLIQVPALAGAKLALYEAMRKQRLGNSALARRLNVSETIVRRLLDLRHQSHIKQVEEALAELGLRLVITVQHAA